MPHSLQCFIAWFDDLALSDRGRSTNISFEFHGYLGSRVLVRRRVAAVGPLGSRVYRIGFVRVITLIFSALTNRTQASHLYLYVLVVRYDQFS